MKPSGFLFWRKRHYTDDGCTLYECLNCHCGWEGRDDPHLWNFCPHCGCEWVGQLICRDTDTPRWLWDRVERALELDIYDPKNPESVRYWNNLRHYSHFLRDRMDKLFHEMEAKRGVWVIESKMAGHKDWELEDALPGHRFSAKDALHRARCDAQESAIERANKLAKSREDFDEDFFKENPTLVDSWYPEKTWRVGRMLLPEFKKNFPHSRRL